MRNCAVESESVQKCDKMRNRMGQCTKVLCNQGRIKGLVGPSRFYYLRGKKKFKGQLPLFCVL